MRKNNRNHQTQWAAQFAVASELCKRGYEVSFTLGHSAPLADLIAISPKAKVTVLIDVKGLYKKNPWLIKRKKPRTALFYVLTYLEADKPNRFFVMSQREVNRSISLELRRLCRQADYPVTGFVWSAGLRFENRWDRLPP